MGRKPANGEKAASSTERGRKFRQAREREEQREQEAAELIALEEAKQAEQQAERKTLEAKLTARKEKNRNWMRNHRAAMRANNNNPAAQGHPQASPVAGAAQGHLMHSFNPTPVETPQHVRDRPYEEAARLTATQHPPASPFRPVPGITQEQQMAQYIRVNERENLLADKTVQGHNDVVKSLNQCASGIRETWQDQSSRNKDFLETIGVSKSLIKEIPALMSSTVALPDAHLALLEAAPEETITRNDTT